MAMRKILTRLATIVLILVVSVSFSACSLFTTNMDKKYSADTMVVTAANDDITISRQELYYGYLEWGYQYASYYSSSDDLLEYIATALVNSKILEKKSIEQFGALRDAEKALALQQAYKTLDATLRSSIYDALGLDDEDDDDDDSDDDTEVDQQYDPSILVSYENGERVFTMDLSSYADEEGTGTLVAGDYEYYVPTIPGVVGNSQKLVKQAIAKMVRNLQSVESGFTDLKTPERDYLQPENEYFKYLSKAERAVLNREIDRMVKANETSIAVERINTAYNLGFTTLSGDDAVKAWDDYLTRGRNFAEWCDMINGVNESNATDLPAYFGCGGAVATNIANNAIEYYIEKTANAINNQKNFPDSDLESTLMSSGLADVYYIPSDVASNLFNVSHILIGFTDEQKTEYTRIQTEAENNPSYNPQNDLNQLYAETMSNGVSADDVLIEVQTALKKADTLQEKYKIFREYINKYNSDPGMQNLEQLNSSSQPQYEYLMSGTADNNSMVEAFTEASIELFEAGEKGAISGLVWSEYGAHIIMYTRDVGEFIYTGAAGMESSVIELLKKDYGNTLFATLTSYGKRTLFDTLVDAYFARSYTNYRSYVLNDYKSEHQITVITSEFKNFF